MPGRHYTNANGYRYGFNGKENDDETGTQDYGMRIYNPNLGRFLSVDPISKNFPWNSTYAFAENGGCLAISSAITPVPLFNNSLTTFFVISSGIH